ncbi:MAG: asparagine synthase (glutamine-hydrolyzing) [Candidatus Omnitrophica bacterium]|nr:asparagine synthase (glutamine-hydrolyzing) [Candidatus Omnitrophota bacterium]
MCGIFGAITEKGLHSVDMDNAQASLRHRGPDGCGRRRFNAACGNVLDLVHLRLAIIDLSARSAQPMSYDNDNLHIVYNGEIYNHVELRQELTGDGFEFKTRSDTEVILASYKRWGRECVEHFNGDWAFCIFDKSNNRIFLSRDRLGVKPLYYCRNGQGFFFASEIKTLFKIPSVSRQWDNSVTGVFMLFGVSDFSKQTMYKGIYQLEPANSMLLDMTSLKPQIHRYWDPGFNRSKEPLEASKVSEYARNTGEILRDSVRLRLRSDVPVGTCLSGGIDSSAITGIISALIKAHCRESDILKGRQMTFTAAYKDGGDIDETKWADTMIRHANACGEYVYPCKDGLSRDLELFLSTHDELSFSTSSYAQFSIMRRAARDVKVVLDGQGADELFAGYGSYRKNLLKMILSAAPGVFLRAAWRGKIRTIESMLGSRFDLNFALNVIREKYSLCLGESLYNDTTRFNLQQLLRYEDRNSMRFGIESRAPFTDYRLVEYALNMPPAYKIHNGWTKYILRMSLKAHVPEQIIWRRDKIGFQTPEKDWLPGISGFNDFVQKYKVRYNGDYFWWRAFNLFKLKD